jgi:hypothetical protein
MIKQKFSDLLNKNYKKTVDTVDKGDVIKKSIVTVIESHSNVGQTRAIKSNGLTMKIEKTGDLFNSKTFYEGLSKLIVPSFCSLLTYNCLDFFENITITVKFLLIVLLTFILM